MRKSLTLLLMILMVVMNFFGCGNENKGNKQYEDYFITSGMNSRLYRNKLAVFDKCLKIIDLDTKREIKSIDIPYEKIGGFDIYGDNIVWADCRDEKSIEGKEIGNENCNSDIFIYNIKTDTIKQLTKDDKAQINPSIWGKYVVWQDNCDDDLKDGDSQWNIYLYDIEKDKKKLISAASGVHTNPKINDFRIVWEDGRHFNLSHGLRYKYDLPSNNTDIFMYDILEDRYITVAQGKYQECRPDMYRDTIVWEDRNNGKYNGEIKLKDLESHSIIKISSDNLNNCKPKIFEKTITWIGEASNELFKSEIHIYNIEKKTEDIVTSSLPVIECNLNEAYIAYSTGDDVNGFETRVMRLK